MIEKQKQLTGNTSYDFNECLVGILELDIAEATSSLSRPSFSESASWPK